MTTKMPDSGWELPQNKAITSLMKSFANQIDQASQTHLLQRLKQWDATQSGENGEMTPEERHQKDAQVKLAKSMLPEKFHSWIDTKLSPVVQQKQRDEQLALSEDRYAKNVADIVNHLKVTGGLDEADAQSFATEYIRPLLGDKALTPSERRAFLDTDPQMKALNNFLRRLKNYTAKESGHVVGSVKDKEEMDRQNLNALIDAGKKFANGDPAILDSLYRRLSRKSTTFGDAYVAQRLFDSHSGAVENMPSRLDEKDVGKWAKEFESKGLTAPEAKALLMLKFNRPGNDLTTTFRNTANIQKLVNRFFGESDLAQDIETVGTSHYWSDFLNSKKPFKPEELPVEKPLLLDRILKALEKRAKNRGNRWS